MMHGSSGSSTCEQVLRAAATDPSCRRLVDVEGYTDLHLAVHLHDPELLCHLLSRWKDDDDDVDVPDAFQRTALMIAILRDDLTAARSLLKAQASASSQDSGGTTPVAMAIQLGHHYCMFLLMHYGAMSTLQTANHEGQRPLHFAASSGDLLTVRLLVKWQCNLLARDQYGKSALDSAVSHGHGAVVDFLTADLEIQSDHSENKRHHSLHQHDLKVTFRAFLQYMLHKFMYPDQVTRRVVPVFCHGACACAVWEHVAVSRSLRWLAMPRVSFIFEVSVPVILTLAQYIIRMDPGLAAQADGVGEFISQVASDLPREMLPKPKQLCTTTWILKDLRTKYCSLTGSCIEEFDHFCILLNAPIGRKNHQPFLCLLILEVISQMTHGALCLCTLAHTAIGSTTYSEAGTALMQHPVITFLLVVHVTTVPGISLLILVQFALISQNVTMNEMLHMQRYEHFWSKEKRFINPFSKGNVYRNCLDFWWTRTRGEICGIG